MSDLDTDLYGDLYGDDNEFAVPTEESKEAKPQTQKTEKTTTPSATPATPVAPTKTKSPSPQPPVATTEESPILSLANGNAPQPIQSYQSSTQDYPPRVDQGYRSQPQHDLTQTSMSPLQVVDRHIRPSEMKDEGKMFIGGLNWDTTDEGLKKYFEQFGRVEACTIMRDATGRSRCFAFLTFEEPASVNAVMVREHVLDGKIIDPKRAIPRQEHQRAQKLFVGGLAGTVTSESMREFFSQYGKVIDSTVMLDRETGRSKGFGFVSFENTNVDPLLGFGKLEIDGKMIDVKLAQPRHQRDNMGNEGGSYHSGGGYGGQSDGNAYSSSVGGTPSGFGTGQAVAMGAGAGAQASGGGGGTPFDPQALAQLYTRMFQQFGGATGMGGMGGMGMMGGAGGMAGMGGMGGMGMGAGTSGGMGRMGGGMGAGTGMMTMGAGPMGPMGNRGGMGAGMGGGAMMGGGPMNAPRGPRGAAGGPGQGGLGPQRTHRGHNYHPYSR